MNKIISAILSETTHRPWPLPAQRWCYYQEWNSALFLHWEISPLLLKPLLPSSLKADVFDGSCYVSLVAFTMNRIRPRFLPSVSLLSHFDEVNLRTYVVTEDKPGVYFLNIEAGKRLSSLVAKTLSGLPYEYSRVTLSMNCYQAQHPQKPFYLNTCFKPASKILASGKSTLDTWLTERYALYLDVDDNLYRYHIHHKPWDLQRVEFQLSEIDYSAGDFNLNQHNLHSAHYSKGVNVVSWSRERVSGNG